MRYPNELLVDLDKDGLDQIVTFIPGSSKYANLEKLFKELFYQAEFILKKGGIMTILCINKELLISMSKEYFNAPKEHTVYSGDQEMCILTFKK